MNLEDQISTEGYRELKNYLVSIKRIMDLTQIQKSIQSQIIEDLYKGLIDYKESNGLLKLKQLEIKGYLSKLGTPEELLKETNLIVICLNCKRISSNHNNICQHCGKKLINFSNKRKNEANKSFSLNKKTSFITFLNAILIGFIVLYSIGGMWEFIYNPMNIIINIGIILYFLITLIVFIRNEEEKVKGTKNLITAKMHTQMKRNIMNLWVGTTLALGCLHVIY